MSSMQQKSREELLEIKKLTDEKIEKYKAMGLKLDMSRGKPENKQFDLSMSMLTDNNGGAGVCLEDGTDCRNYGVPDGVPALRRIFADLFGVDEKNILIRGNSSLNVMFDTISQGMTHGFGYGPWTRDGKVKFIAVVPGYDRHFSICEYFGIEMINVELSDGGPDMAEIERLVSEDKTIKGVWCVPMYSNPTGTTYSDETVRRFAALKPAAPDFKIFWDNSYCVHHLYDDKEDKLLNIIEEARNAGNPDIVFEFTSTSKITFAGGGISVIAASDKNVEEIRKKTFYQTIGPDKLNQLRHAKFLGSASNIREHMRKHAAIIRPKFETVLACLDKNLGELDIAQWTKPIGGYFISLNVIDGTAKRVVSLCSEMGVTLTPAGSTYPYMKDPRDRNIRIAPTYPPIHELETAAEILCLAVISASAEKLLEN